MGKMHESRFSPGQRINDSFTLIRNFSRKTAIKGKNEWVWECKCDCGNVFYAKENNIPNRRGCQSCTNQITQMELSFRKTNNILHYGLKRRLLKDYRSGAVARGKDFELTFDQFVNLMEQECVYCGKKPELHKYEIQYMQKKQPYWLHNGIDRIDSKKGYTLDNCVSCCKECNYSKHEMTVDEFRAYIDRVYNHMHSANFFINDQQKNDQDELKTE